MKKLLVLITAITVAFGLDIPNIAFGQTKSNSEITQKKVQGQGGSAKTQVIPTISKGKILLDGKTVKELTLKDGTKLDASAIKKDSNLFVIDGALLKYNGQVVQSFVLNNGSSTKLRNECSCYPPTLPPPRPPIQDGVRGGHRTPPRIRE